MEPNFCNTKTFLTILYTALQILLISSPCCVNSFEFKLSNNVTKFVLQRQSTANPDSDPPRWNANRTTLELITNDVTFAFGRVVYKDPIRFMTASNRSVPSFQTNITFQIVTYTFIKNGTTYIHSPDGFAFFITPNLSTPNPDPSQNGASLALVAGSTDQVQWNQTDLNRHLLAIEFDGYKTAAVQDPSWSHIGIDINGLNSVTYFDTYDLSSDAYLYANYTLYAWIEYDSASQLLQVWATNTPTKPTSDPKISYNAIDLSTLFKDEMYVGLTAANGASQSTVNVYSWSFSVQNDGLLLDGGSSPSPSPSSYTKNPASSNNSKSIVPVAVNVSVGVVFCVMLLALAIFFCRTGGCRAKAKHDMMFVDGEIPQLANDVRRHSYLELNDATLGFSEQVKLGEGGFSEVFKGVFPGGSVVAVKKLKNQTVRLEAEFAREVQIIRHIRHRNLLELKGWCYEEGQALMVYPYLENGSLDRYIYSDKRNRHSGLDGEFGIMKRYQILVQVAAALEYLHEGLKERVLHRDVKAANVLLTDTFEAMLGDFGLARLVAHDQVAVSMTAAGTLGYMAPEVIYTRKANDKADVYSFGVLAVEVACGRRIHCSTPEGKDLIDWIWSLHQAGNILDALDPALEIQSNSDNLHPQSQKWRCVLHICLLCCNPLPDNRPSMRQVYRSLLEELLLPLPASFPASIFPGSLLVNHSISTTASSLVDHAIPESTTTATTTSSFSGSELNPR